MNTLEAVVISRKPRKRCKRNLLEKHFLCTFDKRKMTARRFLTVSFAEFHWRRLCTLDVLNDVLSNVLGETENTVVIGRLLRRHVRDSNCVFSSWRSRRTSDFRCGRKSLLFFQNETASRIIRANIMMREVAARSSLYYVGHTIEIVLIALASIDIRTGAISSICVARNTLLTSRNNLMARVLPKTSFLPILSLCFGNKWSA